jgi:acyl transferase domain-containing protein
VSSFGIGGTNAHLVLEEAPAIEPSSESRSWQLLNLSARTPGALEAASLKLAAHIKQKTDINLADAAYTLEVGRRIFPHPAAQSFARNADDAVEALEGRAHKQVWTGVHGDEKAVSGVYVLRAGYAVPGHGCGAV